MSGTDRTRYRVHGVLVAADRVLPGWTVADPDHHGEAWSLSFELGSAPLRREAVPGGGPAHWQWFDGDDATVLLLHGGGDLGVVRITVDRRLRRLAVEHTRDDALDGCIDLLTRWILPDVARAEQTALPLHATALELGGRAVLVCGPSGRGKSSLAAGLLAAGARLVADEPCCVIPGADGAVLPPGRRLLRLNPDTMTAIGGVDTLVPPAGRQVTTDVWGKVVLTDDGPAPPDLSVRTVVMLGDRRPDGPAVEVRPLPGREALLALFAERYARATHPERIRSDFRSATMMLERLTVVEVTVVDDLGRLSEAGRELASLLA